MTQREVTKEEFFKFLENYPNHLECEVWGSSQFYRDKPKGYESIVAMIKQSEEPKFFIWEDK